MCNIVRLWPGLSPDLQQQIHLVLLPAGPPPPGEPRHGAAPVAVDVQDVVREAQSGGQGSPLSDNLQDRLEIEMIINTRHDK